MVPGSSRDRSPPRRSLELVDSRIVLAATLIWTSGMADWARADAVAAFAGAFPSSPPSAARAKLGAPPGPLTATFRAWGLFWRSLVTALAIVFVIPAPWAGVWFYKWVAGKVILPGGRPLRLNGEVGEIWWAFVGAGLVQWIGSTLDAALGAKALGALASLLPIGFAWALVRWFCAHAAPTTGRRRSPLPAAFCPISAGAC